MAKRKKKPTFNDGVEAAAQLHEESVRQYTRLNLTDDAARHAQWASNIRRLKKHEPEPKEPIDCTPILSRIEDEEGSFFGMGS